MSTKTEFLDRLRSELAREMPPPRVPITELTGEPPRVAHRSEPAGIATFTTALDALGGEVHLAPDSSAARRIVNEAIGGRAPVLLGAEPEVAGLELEGIQWPDCGLAEAEMAEISVVGARAAVGVTGSVVIDARYSRGRAVSLLSPACIFIVRSETLVDLPGDILRRRSELWPNGVPSQVVLVTGPSRSADIEMTLTRGVHGPGEVHVVFVGRPGN